MTAQQEDTAVEERENVVMKKRKTAKVDAKKLLVGAGARVLFYPTLLYNVVRNKIQSDFRWWDEVCEFLLLGAVPFPKDVPRLKQLGVGAVITLNEPFETLVSPSLYKENRRNEACCRERWMSGGGKDNYMTSHIRSYLGITSNNPWNRLNECYNGIICGGPKRNHSDKGNYKNLICTAITRNSVWH